MRILSRIEHRRLLTPSTMIMVGCLASVIPVILNGQFMTLFAVTGLLAIVVFSYLQPVLVVLILMLLSTNLLEFVDLSYIPYFQVASGIRLNAQDIVLLILLGMGLFRLHQRREKPLFLRPVLFFFAAVMFSLICGLLSGTTTLDKAFNALRNLSGYLFYVALVGVIDSRRSVRALVAMVFLIVLVSVVIQGFEIATESRLITPYVSMNEYFMDTKTIKVEGAVVPYLWNRAQPYILFGLFLAFGSVFERKTSILSWFLVIIAALGFVFNMARSWLIYITIGLLFLLISLRRRRKNVFMAILTAGLLLLWLLYYWDTLVAPGSFPLLQTWLGRVSTLTRFWEDGNYVGRVLVWQEMFSLFKQSPVWGYGPGGIPLNSDVGMINMLVSYGVLGWGCTLFLIAYLLKNVFQTWGKYPASPERGYAAGLMGLWITIACGYAFNIDFFSFSYFNMMIGLAMAMSDWLSRHPGEVALKRPSYKWN